MLKLVLLIVLHEALCESILTCTILVVQLNKSFGLITQTIKSLHGLYCTVFKICNCGVTLIPSLRQVFMEASTKASASLILSRVVSNLHKYDKK